MSLSLYFPTLPPHRLNVSTWRAYIQAYNWPVTVNFNPVHAFISQLVQWCNPASLCQPQYILSEGGLLLGGTAEAPEVEKG